MNHMAIGQGRKEKEGGETEAETETERERETDRTSHSHTREEISNLIGDISRAPAKCQGRSLAIGSHALNPKRS